MHNTIIDNLAQLHSDAGKYDSATISGENGISWVSNAPQHWPNAIVLKRELTDIEKMVSNIDANIYPPTILLATDNIPDINTLKNYELREIMRWEGMYLTPENYCKIAKPIKNYTLKKVSSNEEVKDWYSTIKPILLPTKTMSEALLEGFCNNPKFCLLTGYYNGNVVAAGMAYSNNSITGLYFIATNPEYRGKGFATKLVQTLIGNSFRNNSKEIILHSTTAGKALYSKFGFTQAGGISTLWKLGKF